MHPVREIYSSTLAACIMGCHLLEIAADLLLLYTSMVDCWRNKLLASSNHIRTRVPNGCTRKKKGTKQIYRDQAQNTRDTRPPEGRWCMRASHSLRPPHQATDALSSGTNQASRTPHGIMEDRMGCVCVGGGEVHTLGGGGQPGSVH